MEWFKVSNRKPGDWDRVLITCPYTDANGNTHRSIGEAQYNAEEDAFEVWDSYGQDTYQEWNVIAWAPYPEPYDGD